MVDEHKDPVRKSENQSIRPGFLGNRKEGATAQLNDAESAAATPIENIKSEVAGFKAGMQGGTAGGLYRAASMARNVSSGMGKSKIKKAAPLAAIVILLLGGALIIIPAIPLLVIGAIDFNLQGALGYSTTAAVLEETGDRVASGMLGKGEFPAALAGDFAKSGIVVGQVTEAGDFVRTNKYVANIDDTLEVAATGVDYYRYGSEGELAVLFGDKVVKAEDFVAEVESDPKMYAAYSEALDITARFYYSDEVEEIYNDLEIDRGMFADWVSTGNAKEDNENYYARINDILTDESNAEMGGCEGGIFQNEESGEWDSNASCSSMKFGANSAVGGVSRLAGSGANATGKASQLLNMAISSTEPKKAAKAFMAIEEPIQRARLDGSGPVNETMNALMRRVNVSYEDVNTKQCTIANSSILETTNFVAAVSGGGYSQEEANNFSRDRALIAADTISSDGIGGVISDSTLGDSDTGSSKAVLTKGSGEEPVDRTAISNVKGSVNMATAEFDVNSFTSIVGGNRAVAGGAYLSNTINMRTLGGMPSDSSAIAAYQHTADKAMARKANAERATLSPFDVSSPNTFLGSIVNNFAVAYVRNVTGGESGLLSVAGAVASAAGNSASELFGDAMADGNGQKYATIEGNCATVNQAANVAGDIYCNAHNTLTTKYIDYDMDDWRDELGANLKDDGRPEEDSGLGEFIAYGMDREATVGVKSASVCEAWHKKNDNLLEQFLQTIKDALGITYVSCDKVDEGVANGALYTLSDSNSHKDEIEKYSGYVIYDKVYSLMSGEQSKVSAFKEEYYKKHPKDDSAAGKIARMSGMTKAEAEIALNYASYLAMVNSYDASTRFAFGGLKIEQPLVIVDDAEIKETIYGFWQGKTEYADLRNRNQVA